MFKVVSEAAQEAAMMLDGIVHTTHHHRSIDVVACRADDKDVAYALVEKQFDR